MTVTGRAGTTYHIVATPIGSGGEGDIFRAHITRIAKIYKPGVLTRELEKKLKIMIEHPPNESVLSQAAWPLDLIYDDNSQCIGFTMPELSINAELGEVYKYPSALPISAHQKINIAQNICAVISEVHKAGYIFGDFNPRNIGLDINTGLVSFLDTDTYHVVDQSSGETHRCNVCAPGYAAPELLEKCSDFAAANPMASENAYAQTPLPTFTQETDNFALAIHIFKLLMNGYTPFGGIIENASVSQSSPGVGDAAVRRDSYCFKPGYKHQSVAIPAIDAFPKTIVNLFTRAFIDGKSNPTQRPNAAEWYLALEMYEKSLVTCPDNPLHQYESLNDVCPYCEADRRFGAIVSGNTPVIELKQSAYTTPPVTASKRKTSNPIATATQSYSKRAKKQNTPTAAVSKSHIISAGTSHSAAITADSSLFVWGSNEYGQIGDGTTKRRLFPEHILDDALAVTAGEFHTMAITADRKLWAWGNNDCGQLGDGTFEHRYNPVKVLTGVIAVSAGNTHTLAITDNGRLWAWGNNENGQLGNGSFENCFAPVMIMESVKYIHAGYNESAAIKDDGTLFLWGYTLLDDPRFEDTGTNLPVPIQNIKDVMAVSLGRYHAMAITSDNSLWAWGYNENGQLGDDTGEDNCTPIRIMGNIVIVSAGDEHTTAITKNNHLLAWGLNEYGQLGNSTKTTQYAPVKVMENVVATSASQNHTMAITADGRLWAWGNNKKGKLGDGSTRKNLIPYLIMENMMLP